MVPEQCSNNKTDYQSEKPIPVEEIDDEGETNEDAGNKDILVKHEGDLNDCVYER